MRVGYCNVKWPNKKGLLKSGNFYFTFRTISPIQSSEGTNIVHTIVSVFVRNNKRRKHFSQREIFRVFKDEDDQIEGDTIHTFLEFAGLS